MELCFYGVGVIFGAGIYSLIGVGAGIAGNALWLSFIIAAVIATFTGLSYAELSSIYPKEAAEYNYSKKAFNRKNLSFIIGWLVVVASIVASVTVVFGFSGYFIHIFGGNTTLISVLTIIVLSLINYMGIKNSSNFNIVSTLVESSGLLIVILIGFYLFLNNGISVNLLETPHNSGITSILSATALIFFAYLGFEDIVNVSEETKNAKKNVPISLILSIIISTIFYILVSFTAVGVLGWEKLASSKAPLTEVVSSVFPQANFTFSLIALFATINTALFLLIVASRILYGMSSAKSLPGFFSIVGKRGTPYNSVFVVALAALIIAFIGNIKTAAMITDISLFIVYASVNSSLIALRYKQPKLKRGFMSPVNIGKFPILAFLGLLTSIFMLFYFERSILIIELAVIIVGYFIYKFSN